VEAERQVSVGGAGLLVDIKHGSEVRDVLDGEAQSGWGLERGVKDGEDGGED
jgi:hypothetical protein